MRQRRHNTALKWRLGVIPELGKGRMYLLLLIFGVLLTAAGVLLAALGVSVHDHTLDPTIVTPGVVAAVGGLLLIGLGLALRVLQRIERALASRPAQPVEPVLEPVPVALSFPSVATSRPRPVPVAAALPVATDGKRAEEAQELSPLAARFEATRPATEVETSTSPNPAVPFPTSVDIAAAQVDKAHAAKRRNGATPSRIAPRLDLGSRSPNAPERPASPSFDTLWPKALGPARSAQPTPLPAIPTPVQPSAASAPEPEETSQPPVEAAQTIAGTAASESVSVLKSGVVDGMAYTLYSDGSIEAQLPQGVLRFGSITELRNHIEQSA